MTDRAHLPARRREVRVLEPTAPSVAPMTSMVAAASRLTNRQIRRSGATGGHQDESWTMYDQVGELRFVANALASAASRAMLFAARMPAGDDQPEPLSDEDRAPGDTEAIRLAGLIGSNVVQRAELVRRMVLHLFVPGDSYLVGLPPGVLGGGPAVDDPADAVGPDGEHELDLESLTWHVFSTSELTLRPGTVVLNLGDGSPIELDEDLVYLVRVWRPHPRRWWEPDSPVRSNLPVLRELVGLTKHVGASIDSRLAGAGLLVLGQSVEVVGAAVDPETGAETPVNDFVDALTEAMVQPLENRDSAAALVPLVIKVPDDVVDKVQHITFATPFDEQAKELRDEAIRRLALGLDAPPEVLLGLGSTNHWSAWQIDEATTKTHIEPLLGLVCDALTTQFLWPALEAAGVDNFREFILWYDTAPLTMRPNRPTEATEGHDRGLLSDEAWRRYLGFDESDAPEPSELDQAVELVLNITKGAPNLVAQDPSVIATLLGIFSDLLAGNDPQVVAAPDAPAGEPSGSGRDLPDTQGEPPALAAALSRVARNHRTRRLAEARMNGQADG
jgi:hypothetical protein